MFLCFLSLYILYLFYSALLNNHGKMFEQSQNSQKKICDINKNIFFTRIIKYMFDVELFSLIIFSYYIKKII